MINTGLKINEVEERVIEKKYVNVTKNRKELVVYIVNNRIAGIYENKEIRVKKGFIKVESQNLGTSTQKILGVKRSDFMKMVNRNEDMIEETSISKNVPTNADNALPF